MHIHILGICGTFMGGVAMIARSMGMRVSGCDANVYPPMSTQLEEAGIQLVEGYEPEELLRSADCVVIGNALSRGNPAVESVLDQGKDYTSGPDWLARHVLRQRWVLAVAGTHGKTTTSSMLGWILEHAGLQPGFLIGGIPANFGCSARLGREPFFVVEADEYDCAFFDKRSKFLHYRPRTLVINNLEYDHADIFPDLAAIQTQFHHLVRMVPASGLIVTPCGNVDLDAVLSRGCWTTVEKISELPGTHRESFWSVADPSDDGGSFTVLGGDQPEGRVQWEQMGWHNVANALAAIAAARHAGVPPSTSIEALRSFRGVKRRMEVRGCERGITVYDDFAHHPTAIETTLSGLRRQAGDGCIIAVLEPRSNTMRLGVHKEFLAPALRNADRVLLFQPEDLPWNLQAVATDIGRHASVFRTVDEIVAWVVAHGRAGDRILIMSNGAFGGIHERMLRALSDSGSDAASSARS